MQTITSKQGQTLWDIALQYCGDVSAAAEIGILNGMDVTFQPATGTSMVVPDVINKRVVKYFKDNRINPATAWQEQ